MGDQEEAKDIFIQDGVILKQTDTNHINFLNGVGTLNLTEAVHGDAELRTLEWRPNDVTVDSDTQDQEWAVVHAIPKRTRTLSGSLPPDYHTRVKSLRVPLGDIGSFKVAHKFRELTLYYGRGDVICIFLFQTDCNLLVYELKRLMNVKACKRNKNLFYIENGTDAEMQQLKKSFAELNLGNDDSGIWRLVRNFKQQPYETTFEAFSKVTMMMYKNMDNCHELDASGCEALSRSITEYESSTSTSASSNTQQVVGSATNDYEMLNAPNTATSPRLPPRKDFPRLKPLQAEIWTDHKDCEGRVLDVESVKNQIFRGGVCPSIRAEVWKYLLDYYPWNCTNKERETVIQKSRDEYFSMKLQWRTITKQQEDNFSDFRERKSLIEKDVNRTDRNLPFYAGDDNVNIPTLYEILMTYVMYNFDLGYVQGMSDLLSPIFLLLEDEVEAFWCFVGFMKRMRTNFDIDQAGMKEQFGRLNELLVFFAPDLAQYLTDHDSSNMFFTFRWLLVWFKRELDEAGVMRLWEVLWTGLPCQNFHLLCSLAILEQEKTALMSNDNGFTEILKHINELSGKLDVDSILNKAEGIYHQIKSADHLTDNIRLILGLPIPVPSEPSEGSSSRNDSIENVRISPDEHTYERSLSNSYL